MKAMLSLVAVVSSLILAAAIAFANPALMKKQHDGYPNEGVAGATTATGEAAKEKAAEDAPKTLKDQLKAAEGDIRDHDQIKRSEDSRIPAVVAPRHVGSQGVSESHIKDATKVNAEPK